MFHVFPHELLMHLVEFVGYPGIAAIVFLESGVFFGFFLPGASMLFTAGILAGTGYFNPWILIPLVSIAAILGDNAGYWFGYHVGKPLLERNTRFFRHEHLIAAHDFYEKHGVLAIVLARFVPIIRTFAPIIAGIAEMRYRVFLAYNILGGVLWGAGMTALGYYLGRIPFVEHYLTAIVAFIIVLTLLPLAFKLPQLRRSSKSAN